MRSVALISLFHTWFSARAVCVRSLSKHMTFTHGFEYCMNVGLLGSLGKHMERVCTPADPRVTARPERCVPLLFHHTLSVHTTSLPNKHEGLHVYSDIIAALCIASTRLCLAQSTFLNGLNALSAIRCVSNMQTLVKKKYTFYECELNMNIVTFIIF